MSTLETFSDEKFRHLTVYPLNKTPIRSAVSLARINAASGQVSRVTVQRHVLAQVTYKRVTRFKIVTSLYPRQSRIYQGYFKVKAKKSKASARKINKNRSQMTNKNRSKEHTGIER